MKKHNFYAGPSILSQYTLDKCVDAIRDFAGTGLSILEISHRSTFPRVTRYCSWAVAQAPSSTWFP